VDFCYVLSLLVVEHPRTCQAANRRQQQVEALGEALRA
jgi:hypothetical protein